MNFETLLGRLPRGSGSVALPLQINAGGAISYPTHLEEFVAPDVSARADVVDSSDNSVIIISAAGAVGKSTLARELACSTQAPLWDLSRSGPVGQHSLQGMIASAFGPAALGQFSASITSGSLVLVIDALDEARIKVTEGAFESFVADIAALAGQSTAVRVVLLGRTQVAETTWLLLNDANVSTALYVIDPFTQEQAHEYIRRRIQRIGGSSADRMAEHAGPFAAARDLIFKSLRSAISDPQDASTVREADAFIGYAPVLDAIAILLARETNYVDLVNQLRDDRATTRATGEHGHIALLSRIVERILDREQNDKLVHNLKPVLGAAAQKCEWNKWSALYTADEQCARLIGQILNRPIVSGQSLPQPLKTQYEEQLQSFLPEHPFLQDGRAPANIVFESYLFARALLHDTSGCRSLVEARVCSLEYKPSRLLADFYLSEGHMNGSTEVPGAHIGILYESLASAETNSLRVHLSIEGVDPEDVDRDSSVSADGEFELRHFNSLDGSTQLLDTLAFRTSLDADTQIRFIRSLRDAAIVVPSTVSFGTGSADFEIGSRVQVRCGTLVINALTVVVGCDSPRPAIADAIDAGAVLEASHFQGMIMRPPVVRGDLAVSWPGAEAHPWTQWHRRQTGLQSGNDNLTVAYRRFRRIVMTLRSHSKGRLARYRGKIEHQRVLQGAMGSRMLQRLLGDGILTLEGKFYFWAPDTANRLVAVSWQDLKSGIASVRLSEYLKAFIQEHAGLFDS